MKIKEPYNKMLSKEDNEEIINVFAIYWGNNKTLCYGMPKGYGGLCAYDLNEVTVIDPTLTGEFIYLADDTDPFRGIFHWALIKEELLDDILELDETAYKRFLEIIKSEGLVPQDFY